MNWQQQALDRKTELLKELQQLIQIESVLDATQASETAPFGPKPAEALAYMLKLGQEQGMTTKNVDHVAGHIEMGSGDELLGILCHVDVVPAGDGWTHPPYSGTVADGKLFGRGAIDDKGPTMAAWMAMKLVKDAGIALDKRVRLIIGTDEESGFRCMKRYFETEEMPTIGFAPDADFPIIHAEKGIAGLTISQASTEDTGEIVSFTSGQRTNMVPDEASVTLNIDSENLQAQFEEFLQTEQLKGKIEVNETTHISLYGKAAHAMEPDHGINAGIKLAEFLSTLSLSGQSKVFVGCVVDHFSGDSRGKKFSGAYRDDASGDTTYNAGIIEFSSSSGFAIQVSMRYSVTADSEKLLKNIQQHFKQSDVDVNMTSNSTPHYVEESDTLVQSLKAVYERQTGEPAELLAIGGGTYARVLKKGVAFGMLFPGEADVAHQADEFVDIENLLKATAIYADAIVELAGKKE